MRRRLTTVALLALCSCAGFRALDRRDWVLVWSDESVSTEMVNGTPIEVVKPAPGARQEVIPQERFDSEVADGTRRKVGPTVGSLPKLITEISEPIEMMVGEVRELRIEEPKEADVTVAGAAVRPYWTKRKDITEGDSAKKESSLFLLADEPGSAKVKMVYPGKEPLVVEITVHEK